MKRTIQIAVALWLLLAFNSPLSIVCAQGTAFTYQGRLHDGGNPANGIYDLRFTIYDSTNSPGNILAGPITNAAAAVGNGLFIVTLDFGAGVFSGQACWLQVDVRTNGGGDFVTLAPRLPLTPTPYALTAGAILPGGLPAGTYTNAIIFNNAGNQFFGNGAGITNLPFESLSPAAQAQLTNAAGSAAAAVQSNLNALATMTVDTNWFALISSDHLLVAPYTNLPPYLLTNPFYFCPTKGPDYIQQAINSLPRYKDRQHVGGGEIAVLGINYFPGTLVFSNSGFDGNIMSYKIYAPAFTTASLVCQTNPCIHVYGFGNNHYLSDTAFEMDNLIISSLQNTTAVLFDMDFNVTDSDVERCWFGYWPYLTNNINVGDLEGLGTPNTPGGITKNDLVVKYTPGSTDTHIFRYNHLTGIDCLLVDCDHFQCDFNFFMECGGNSRLGMRMTDWPMESPVPGQNFSQLSTLLWTGAAVVFGQDEPHRNYTFTDNYFYYCVASYFSPWPQVNFYSYQDSYESTELSAISPAGNQFHMINSDAGADTATFNSDNSITQDYGAMRGALWLDASQFPFGQNGGALTNLNASSLTGKLPAAVLPGITTNVSTGVITLYITNGLIMRVSSP